jgi:hypothetical protein
MARRILLLIALPLLAALAAACGGDGANGYRSRVASIQERYRATLRGHETRLGEAIGGRKAAPAASEADAARAVVRSMARDVSALDPPEALAPRARRLLASYRELAAALGGIATALRAKEPATANAAIGRYNIARLDESAAIAALNGS